MCTVRAHHLMNLPLAELSTPCRTAGPCWLTSLSTIPFSDLAVSGSCDGSLRFWHCDEAERKMHQVMTAPLTGHGGTFLTSPHQHMRTRTPTRARALSSPRVRSRTVLHLTPVAGALPGGRTNPAQHSLIQPSPLPPTAQHTTSQHTTAHHITPHHTTPHHTTPYHTTSHHTT